jgi:hypothetical protein
VNGIVYKYLHPDRIDVLENGLIRFTQASALNDPFESTPCLADLKKDLRGRSQAIVDRYRSRGMEAVEAALLGELTIRDRLRQFEKDNTNNYAVLSLSEVWNNLLMWSHYCDSHRGFVIGLDSNHSFFQTRQFKRFSVLTRVKYSQDRPVVPGLEQEWAALAEIIFFTKSRDWAYEKELRMIANPEVADLVKEHLGESIYLYRFPPESIKQVVIGCRAVPDLIVDLTRIIAEQYERVELFTATRSDSKFDLEIQPAT